MRQVAREIAWQGIRTPSLDYCSVSRKETGWLFSGVLVARFRPDAFGARYKLLVDGMFRTRVLVVERVQAGNLTRVRVERRGGEWLVNHEKRADFRECVDVDLEASPVTNTLPIRRTRLKVGERVELTVVWVRFPNLTAQPLKQSYQRLSARKYRYRSASGFSADLKVDDFGLVTRYGTIWKRLP